MKYLIYKIVNKINGHLYIGLHTTDNINDSYMGSGRKIREAIKQYGRENFEKIILYQFNNKKDMVDKEAELVDKEFIKNPNTYNIIRGGDQFLAINMVNVKDKNSNTFMVHKEDPRYLSGELIPVNKNMVAVKDKDDNLIQVHKKDPRYLSGELVGITKNMFTAKDKNNNVFLVSCNDPRYLSGELVGITKNMIAVKDKNNKHIMIHEDDPRYLSGKLVGLWTGRKHKKISIKSMKESHKGKHCGILNSQYGTCWIYSLEMKKSKK